MPQAAPRSQLERGRAPEGAPGEARRATARTGPVAAPRPPTHFGRPRAITLLAAYDLVTAFVMLAVGGVAVYGSTLNA